MSVGKGMVHLDADGVDVQVRSVSSGPRQITEEVVVDARYLFVEGNDVTGDFAPAALRDDVGLPWKSCTGNRIETKGIADETVLSSHQACSRINRTPLDGAGGGWIIESALKDGPSQSVHPDFIAQVKEARKVAFQLV